MKLRYLKKHALSKSEDFNIVGTAISFGILNLLKILATPRKTFNKFYWNVKRFNFLMKTNKSAL